MSSEAYQTLKENIDQNGLMTPITVDKAGRIIDGRARARACVELHLEDAMGDPVVYEFDNIATYIAASVVRADYTSAQRAVLAANLIGPFRIEAAARRAHSTKTSDTDRIESGEAAKQVAAAVGSTNSTYVRAAEKLIEHAPDIVALIQEGVIRTIPEAQLHDQLSGREREERIRQLRQDPSLFNNSGNKIEDDEWLTPPDIAKAVEQAFNGQIACDPCAPDGASYVVAPTRYKALDRGETRDWPDRTYCNPPFSNAAPFVAQAVKLANNSWKQIYMLLPVRPDASHQREALEAATDVLFLGERITFYKDRLGKLEPSQQGGKVSVMILGFNCSTSVLLDFGLSGTVMQRRPTRGEARRNARRFDSYRAALPDEDDSPPFQSDEERAAFERSLNADNEQRQRSWLAARNEVERAKLPALPADVAPEGTIVGSLRKLQDNLKELTAYQSTGERKKDVVSSAIVGQSGIVRLIGTSIASVAIFDVGDMSSSRDLRAMLPSRMLNQIAALKRKRSPSIRIDLDGPNISFVSGSDGGSAAIEAEFPGDVNELLDLRDERFEPEQDYEADRHTLESEIRALKGAKTVVLVERDGEAHVPIKPEAGLTINAATFLHALSSFNERALVIEIYSQPPIVRIVGKKSERIISMR